jgi:hypothetical protein
MLTALIFSLAISSTDRIKYRPDPFLYLVKNVWIESALAIILPSSMPCRIFYWGKDAAVR